MEREAVLMKIKAAEKEAKARREKALQEAEAIKTKGSREASLLISSAEADGRKMMKDALDAARSEEEKKRAARLAEADSEAENFKLAAKERTPRVIEMVTGIFAREFDV